MNDITSALGDAVGRQHVLTGEAIADDYGRDEALTVAPRKPDYLVRPGSAAEVARVLQIASAAGVPVTARGSGTGLCGACVARNGGILMAFERMKRVKEIDSENHMAVVEPGVTLSELDAATRPHALTYPILPGESSGSIGGNVNTNAGGMQAIKYGVTRHNVLGLEVVLATGQTIRTGGKLVKSSTGFDLTQLIIGSEGLLGMVTEVTLKLRPRLINRQTLLLPFPTLEAVTAAIPGLVAAGLDPLVLEYIDMLTMAAIAQHTGLDLGVPQAIKDKALAYLVVVIEGRTAEQVQHDIEAAGSRGLELGAMEAYVLPPQAGSDLLRAREQAFWVAKKAGAGDIIDVVVPRASIPKYMLAVSQIAQTNQTLVVGCGHAGDGNVHLSVFQPDPAVRSRVIKGILAAGMELGGAISAEHGIGSEKMAYYLELEDPTKLALMRGIKKLFDPKGILNPGALLG
jgi:glycolate oxidase